MDKYEYRYLQKTLKKVGSQWEELYKISDDEGLIEAIEKITDRDQDVFVNSRVPDFYSIMEELEVEDVADLVRAMTDSPAFTAYLLKNKRFSEWYGMFKHREDIIKRNEENERKRAKLRESALSKLTDAERKALGV